MRAWWLENNCLVSEYNSLGIKVLDEKLLAIPLFLRTIDEVAGTPTGLALRPLRDDLPKWIILGNKSQVPMAAKRKPLSFGKLVLTEDYISALRCSRVSCAMPLMGVNLSDWHFQQVLKWRDEARQRYSNYGAVVWLDNDSQLVKNKARQIHQRLTDLLPSRILKGTREAKHFSTQQELEDYLWKQI
tara:strand:+ start:51 stop:611 length:561 start_codon:yes stop_codon:yes gene_type:complete